MSRAEIKALAKQQLGGGVFANPWLMAVATVFIMGAISGLANLIPVVGSIGVLVVAGPLAYGLNYIFLKQARDRQPVNIGDLFKGFTSDFGDNFLLGFMSGLFIALWSLLFVIPGIVKTYAYSMAYYIKLDHPEYKWRQCLDQSQAMMKGYKMTLFVQDLSFIGWYIVGSFCLGVGTLWAQAYLTAARAQFYNSLVGWNGTQQQYDPYAGQYQQPQYQQAAPQQPQYQQYAPQQPQYQQPAAPQYPQYQQPAAPQYPQYQQPAAPQYPQYQQPAAPQYPQYQQPVAPQYPQYQQPAAPQYPQYQQPVAPQYPQYQQPAAPQQPQDQQINP